MVIADMPAISTEDILAYGSASKYFPTPVQQFQFYDKYSRYDYDKGRRETWEETVDRAVDYLNELVATYVNTSKANGLHDDGTMVRLKSAILNMKVMPSMRLLAMAGPAARRDNTAIYNCSAIPVDSIRSFKEALLISMAGCGVGFSVERKYINKLPRVLVGPVSHDMRPEDFEIWVEDSTEGWANALERAFSFWFAGLEPTIHYDLLRPAGTVLRTKGGRSSGPEPFRKMMEFAHEKILYRAGGYLTSLDAHDIMCMVGSAAVSGGHRRTAMLSLFDPDDEEMRNCKKPGFEIDNPQRWNANNSSVWPVEGISEVQFLRQWADMIEDGNGEPGIFSRQALKNTIPDRRQYCDFLVNPCGELPLRSRQFCNLSICVARADDNLETLLEKVELATIIGTIQSLAIHFPNLGPEWKKNCEEERLLGVDITGQMDCPALTADTMRLLRNHAVATNKIWADKFGINQSAAVTCVKPSGNSSQLLNCSSGLHPRWSQYYERNVRVSATSPIFKVLRDAGAPMDPENGQTVDNANTWVVHFPVASPEGAVVRTQVSAIAQCEVWLKNKLNWTEHNPSCTITYKPEESMDLAHWVWKHKHVVAGMAYLPAFDAKYDQLPYIEITREEYERRVAEFPDIDYSRIALYEKDDMTEAAQTLACMSGTCDL